MDRRGFLRTTAFLGAGAIAGLDLLESRAAEASSEAMIVEGFRIVNKTPRVRYVLQSAQVRELRRLRDGLLRGALTDAGHKDDFFADPRFELYLNVMGTRVTPVTKRKESYAESYERVKKAYHIEEKKNIMFRLYRENEEMLERAEREFQIPREYLWGLIGIESSFGTYLGEYDFFNSAVSNYLRVNRGEFHKKDWARKQILLGIPELQRIGRAPIGTISSYATAVGPSQFIFSTYAEGHFISSDPLRDPNVFNMNDSIISAANLLRNYGWEGGFDKSPERKSKGWRALQRYNGCIGYPSGDYRRHHYPNLIIDLGDHLRGVLEKKRIPGFIERMLQ